MPRQLLLGFENYYANFAAQRNKVPPILFILGEFLGDFFLIRELAPVLHISYIIDSRATSMCIKKKTLRIVYM